MESKRPSRARPVRETVGEDDPVFNVRAPEGGFKRSPRIPTENELDQAQNERRRLLFKHARVRDMGKR